MKVLMFNVFLVLAALSVSSAQASVLWKISGNGLDKPSYLYGTVHMICKSDFYMDERIETAFNSTETLMLELDMSSQHEMMQLQQLMVNPTGPYLQDYFSDEQYEHANQFFIDHVGANLQFIGTLKPFALQATVIAVTAPCDEVASYEEYFMEQAAQAELEIAALETAEFQATLFDDIPLEQQVEWLWDLIDDVAATDNLFAKFTQAYLAEDMDELHGLMLEDPSFADFNELILDDRNLAWVAPIQQQIHESPTFIAVGAGHLAGDVGMIELLRAEGYSVEAVSR